MNPSTTILLKKLRSQPWTSDYKEGVEVLENLVSAVKVLESIYNADRTKNNGAYMGEATLCKYFQDAAKITLERIKIQ